MNTITIGGAERPLRDADAGWIRRVFEERVRAGQTPCVSVVIQTSDLHIALQTPNCGRGGGGGRPPNVHERKVLELWSMEGLNNPGFTLKGVVDFTERVRHLIR